MKLGSVDHKLALLPDEVVDGGEEPLQDLVHHLLHGVSHGHGEGGQVGVLRRLRSCYFERQGRFRFYALHDCIVHLFTQQSTTVRNNHTIKTKITHTTHIQPRNKTATLTTTTNTHTPHAIKNQPTTTTHNLQPHKPTLSGLHPSCLFSM